MSDSAQKYLKRNRPPRVQISYEDPYNADRTIELPFVMGVMADLSGNASRVEKPPVGERKMLPIDMDNFDKRLSAIEPGARFRVGNKLDEDSTDKLGVSLTFRSMADFEPAAVARQIPELAKLLEARERLAHLQAYMDGRMAAEKQLKELLSDPELMRALLDRRKDPSSPPAAAGETDDDA